MSSTERTPLRSAEEVPNYVFLTSPHRRYRKAQQFKCCMFASVLAVFVLAVVITVSFSMNHFSGDDNSTSPTNMSLITLLNIAWPLPDTSNTDWPDSLPDNTKVEAALVAAENELKQRDELETKIIKIPTDSPSYRHYAATKASSYATELSRSGYILNIATSKLIHRTQHGGSVGQGPTIHASGLDESICSDSSNDPSECLPSPYRTFDGSCNNLQHPQKWGVAFRPFRRSLPPDYGDGISAPRLASDGRELPSAREISTIVHRPQYRDDSEFTVMLAVWGQFIDHDITDTAVGVAKNGKPFDCCTEQEVSHPECFPVPLANGDSYFNQWNISCMNFIRSAPAPTCHLGSREQLNQASSFIDGSVIYGILDSVIDDLRSFKGGELRMLKTEDGRSLLPVSNDPLDGCNQEIEMQKGHYCFASGDARSNENLHLTTMHLIWARQHNKIAQKLANMNPSWDDERLFQETRKIVVAQLQHITYNELLPIILGDELMIQLDLRPKSNGYSTSYNASVDPSIANQFAAAAYRFGHTLLPGLLKFIGNDTSSEEYVELHKMLFNPFSMYDAGNLDRTLQGSFITLASKVNPHFSREVTERLFMKGNKPCGLDLVSLNIQRGRDHGIPAYPAWRELCGFQRPKSFKDLNGVMDPDSIAHISRVYKSVNDIDLYTGALSEYPVEGGMVGPTIICLLADQFLRLKLGDRHWYETSEQPQAFTPEQLNEIRKTSLASIICDNADKLTMSPPLVMRITDTNNKRMNCSEIPRPDLSFWMEDSGIYKQVGKSHVSMGSITTNLRVINVEHDRFHLDGLVVSINITTNNSTWSPMFPVSIPIEPYSITEPLISFIWKGGISNISSTGLVTLQGTFSIPIKRKAVHNSSDIWLNGNCSIHVLPTSPVTDKSLFPDSEKYSVSLNLKQKKEYSSFKNISSNMSYIGNHTWNSEYSPSPIIFDTSITGKVYVTLYGTFSISQRLFLWPGNSTLVVKKHVSIGAV